MLDRDRMSTLHAVCVEFTHPQRIPDWRSDPRSVRRDQSLGRSRFKNTGQLAARGVLGDSPPEADDTCFAHPSRLTFEGRTDALTGKLGIGIAWDGGRDDEDPDRPTVAVELCRDIVVCLGDEHRVWSLSDRSAPRRWSWTVVAEIKERERQAHISTRDASVT